MRSLQFLASSDGDTAAGLFGGIFGLFILVLSVFWLILPFIIISKFNELLRVQRHATTQIQALIVQLSTLNQSALEKTKALQWMVDNWPEDRKPEPGPGSPNVYRID